MFNVGVKGVRMKIKNKLPLIMVVLLIIQLSASTGYADRGLSVGVDLGIRDFIDTDVGKAISPGPAADMYMQFGITDVLALKVGMPGSIHSGKGIENNQSVDTSIFFSGMNIGLDFDLIPDAIFQPIIDIGMGGYRLGSTSFMMYNGWNSTSTSLITWGINAGTGFDYYVNKSVTIGARMSYLYMPVPAVSNGVSKILNGSNIFAGINLAYHFDFSGKGIGMMMPMGCMGMSGHKKNDGEKGE